VASEQALKRLAERGGWARIAHYGAYLVVVTVIAWFDPFGVGDALDRVSERVAYRLLFGRLYQGAAYPDQGGTASGAMAKCPARYRKPRVAAVVLRDQDLALLNKTWPVPLRFQAKVLAEIRHYKPSAVLVDFVFPDQRDEATSGARRFASTVRNYERRCVEGGDCSAIPLYVARAVGQGLRPIRDDLKAAVGPHLVDVPVESTEGLIRSYWPYAKVDGLYDRDRPTAAFRIYDDLARQRPAGTAMPDIGERGSAPDPPAVPETPPIGDRFDADMDIVWSNNVGLMNRKWMRGCQTYDSFASLFLNYLIDDSAGEQSCPFTESVPVAALLGKRDDPDIACLLSDAVVVYGADLGVGSDVMSTAVHPTLAGLYVHAMALDNLFYFGDRYKRSDKRTGLIDITKNRLEWFFSVIMMWFTIFVIRRRYSRFVIRQWFIPTWLKRIDEHWEEFAKKLKEYATNIANLVPHLKKKEGYTTESEPEQRHHKGPNALTWLVMEVSYFGAAVAFAAFTYYFLDFSPANWLGLFGLASTVLFLTSRRWVEWLVVNLSDVARDIRQRETQKSGG